MHASPSVRRGDDREYPRHRRRSPRGYEPERKRYRARSRSPDRRSRDNSYSRRSWDREAYEHSRRISSQHMSGKRTSSYNTSHRGSYQRRDASPRGYKGGYQGVGNGTNGASATYQARNVPPMHHASQNASKSKRLYIGNLPFHAGLTDFALTQFFSAVYVAAFRPNQPGEALPVLSFWLHADGKFGFMELRGEQEAVNMMQFNGVFLHGRPLRVNRPSDYRPEHHNPGGLNLVPDTVNIPAVMELCEKLGGIVAAPAQIAAIAASKAAMEPAPGPIHMNRSTEGHYQSSRHDSENASRRVHTDADAPLVTAPATGSTVALPRSEKDSPHDSSPTEPVVISLKNLVTDEDLDADEKEYEEIVSDVREECGTHGVVESLSIPRSGPWRGTAFVHFRSSEGAKSAMNALRKQVFDGRQIVAIGLKGCKSAEEAANRPRM